MIFGRTTDSGKTELRPSPELLLDEELLDELLEDELLEDELLEDELLEDELLSPLDIWVPPQADKTAIAEAKTKECNMASWEPLERVGMHSSSGITGMSK